MKRSLRTVGICISALFVLASLAIFIASPAGAVDTANFSVAPFSLAKTGRSIFVYEVPAGSMITDSLTVANLSDVERTFALYPADGYVTESGGAFALSTPDPRSGVMAEQKDVGAWIQIPAAEIRLPPKESVTVSFTVRIPNLARVGDHSGGILVIDKTAPSAVDQQNPLQTNVGIGARMYITVAGQRLPKLRVEDVEFIEAKYSSVAPIHGVEATKVRVKLRNEGNTRLYPSIDFIMRDSFNREISRQRLEGAAELAAGTSTYVLADFPKLQGFGSGVTVEVVAADGDVVSKGNASHNAPPWLAFVLLAFVVGWLLRRFRSSASEKDAVDPS